MSNLIANTMPQFLTAIPVLPALDIAATIAFYNERLGFKTEFQTDDYAGVCRGGIQIHLWLCSDRQIAENSSCRIHVAGIDQLYQELQDQQIIHPNGELMTKPWGLREFTALDLNGNAITFAETAPPTRQRDRTD